MSISETIYTNALNSSLEQDSQMQLQNAENMLYELAENGSDNKSFVDLKTSVNDSVANITKAMKNPRHITGISTGFLELDKLLCGFQDSDLVILAARPSMGKTALAINMAVNACNFLVEETKITGINKSVGFFSLEMSSQQLAMRIISMNTSINSSFLKSGGLTEEQYNKLQRESAKLSELPLFLDDTPALTINALRTRAKKLKRKNNLAILFIDYLQLIRGNSKHENRVNEVSEITQGLKLIAKELNIPVIALAQLSRAVETREDKRPMLSDLRESGSIEQDADIVMFIYRDEYYLTRKQPDGVNKTKMDEWQLKMNQSYDIAEILIAKHRNGAIGNAHIGYDNTTSKFSNKVNVVNKEFHTF
jgi:replicative DNA helicase